MCSMIFRWRPIKPHTYETFFPKINEKNIAYESSRILRQGSATNDRKNLFLDAKAVAKEREGEGETRVIHISITKNKVK